MSTHRPQIEPQTTSGPARRHRFPVARVGKSLCVAVLAFLLAYVFAQPLSFSAGTLLASHDRKDFNMTDFYNIVADSRPVRSLDDKIVIVNIDNTTREDVTDVIELLSVMEPAAVGLDVTFNEPHADDSRLLEAINNCHNLVMAVGVSAVPGVDDAFLADDYSFFYPSQCRNHRHGVVNLPAKFDGGTIRELQLRYPDQFGSSTPSMALALAELADSSAVVRLDRRGTTKEVIDYPSRTFDVIDWRDLPDESAAIAGKIVLVGALGEYGDLHRTPVDENMSGVMIHAHALSTLLRGDYYTVVANWVNMSLAFLLCFLLAFAHLSLKAQIKGLVLRIVQVAVLYLIIRTGYALFVDRHLIIDFSFSLLMLTFGLFACDVWIGLSYLLGRGISYFSSKDVNNHTQTHNNRSL